MTHGVGPKADHFAADAASTVEALTEQTTAAAIGPGIGRADATIDFVESVYRACKRPMVCDADALYALAERKASIEEPGGIRILTPHPGEFARLAGNVPTESERSSAAADLARRDASGNTIVVLKGHQTVVSDGQRYSVNGTGNPGMATGGSGDVLTGIITALLCQGLAPFDAARLGVHVHGLSGDLAAEELGQVSMIASDLIDYLPKAFQAVIG